MHAPNFALINLNLKLWFCTIASYSLLLILLCQGKGPGKGPAKDTLLIIDTRGVKVTSDNNGEFDDDLDEEEDDPLGSAIQTK